MSVDLDTRARDSARHLRTLVDDARLDLADFDAIQIRRGGARHSWAAAAGVVAVVIAIMWFFDPLPAVEPAADPATTFATVTSSAPQVVPPQTTAETLLGSGTTVSPQPADLSPPLLVITQPLDGQTFSDKDLVFAGITEIGARVFAGPYEAEVGSGGSWRILLFLSEGENRVPFRAIDAAANEAEAIVTVHYQPPVTTTATTKPQLAAFDANFTWGECNVEPPFDEYYGVGQPGSKVTVESPHGFGTTTVSASGEWYLKVEFPSAPPGKTFSVKAFDQFGRKEVFEFTSTVGS